MRVVGVGAPEVKITPAVAGVWGDVLTRAHSQKWLFHGRNRSDANAKAHTQDRLCHVNGGRGLALFFRTRKIRALLLKMARPVARSGGESVSGYATGVDEVEQRSSSLTKPFSQPGKPTRWRMPIRLRRKHKPAALRGSHEWHRYASRGKTFQLPARVRCR